MLPPQVHALCQALVPDRTSPVTGWTDGIHSFNIGLSKFSSFFPGVIWHCGCCSHTSSLHQLHHGWLCIQIYKRHLQPSRWSPMPNAPSLQFVRLPEPISPAISSQLCATSSTALDIPGLFLWSPCAGPHPPIHFESSAGFVFSDFRAHQVLTCHSSNGIIVWHSPHFLHHSRVAAWPQFIKHSLCT